MRGKKITAPDNLPVRPTTDFAKTGLFNILSNHLNFSTVTALDLFTGTGNISYELISRGVKNVTAVDADKRCIAFVQKIFNDIHAENAE
ncbi:MAG: RsmD family RNA methyltransferase, partial [Bacteroidota bacterium]